MTAAQARQCASPRFVDVEWRGRRDRIEYAFIDPAKQNRPLLVFLHEGLGSLAMWRTFPETLCSAADCRGLVMSRWGYGASSPRAPHEPWPVEFMHHQAHEFLPAFFDAVELDPRIDAPWFYGHSDGGSIALIYAAAFPQAVGGLVVAAPHIFVEDLTLASIEKVRQAYLTTDLREKLGRYHADPDSAFWGWNHAWLNPAFRHWSIKALLADVRCPTLVVQGYDDEYGSMEQVEGIAQAIPHAQRLELHDCGHSPHRDQPQQLIQTVSNFIQSHFSRPS